MKQGFSIAAAAALMALAACGAGPLGPSDRQVLVEACVAEGESEAACTCIADAFEANLPPELYRKTAQRIGRDGMNIAAFIGEFDADEMLAFSAAVEDMMECPLAD